MAIKRKPTKTISGVAPLAVMLPPRECAHGACLFCPTLNAPQSYTPQSPAVLRGASLGYDAKEQVKSRLEAFKAMGHPTDKIELIIMGGTFLQYDRDFQFQFVKDCYDALNGRKSKDLESAKKVNEKARHRCVAMCIETRPDWCSTEHIKDMLGWGATRVEIGVQAISDRIYKKNRRGHKVKDVILATERLKKAGFKVGYHLMPGIYGSNLRKDLRMYKKLFSSSKFQPDQVKIYPCQVMQGSCLVNLYFKGKYKPYTKEETERIIIDFLKNTPRYVRVMRIMREIPPNFLIAGVINIDLRRDIEKEIRRKKIKIDEIRFREVGFALRDGREIKTDTEIKKTEYKASNGKEIFLEATNSEDVLFGLLRLRIENEELATIRELHVYGPTLKLHKRDVEKFQHTGLGKKFMIEAERIAKERGSKKMRVISGVGVREYYYNLGYKLDKEGVYVEKVL